MGTIHRLIEAKRAEREEEGKDAGFSLIELIVVVVILGILVAIAIPVFNGIQQQAKQSALDTITANAATQAATGYAKTPVVAPSFTNFTSEANAPAGLALTVTATAGKELDTFCVTGKATGLTDATSGPGCTP